MPVPPKRALHPLLLERGYWRNRLEELRLTRLSVLLIPRAELSTGLVEVDEFRIRAHDGIRLFGIRALCRFGPVLRPARIRCVGTCDLPDIDTGAVCRGAAEFVFQQPAGRRLEDRVLDLLRVFQLAVSSENIDPRNIELVVPDGGPSPDEFLIASQLVQDEFNR